MARRGSRVLFFLSVQALLVAGALSATFTFSNNCGYTVWPGLLSGAGTPPLPLTGFALEKGETRSVSVPSGWSGRFWGRTLCSADPSSGKFSCATGDCGTGAVECSGRAAAPPATLAEFTLNGSDGKDFYDVSLVDGYNLPVLVVPQGGAASTGGNGTCTTTGCVVDLNGLCPSELRVTASGEGVACRSACEAFGKPEYCCNGAYATPDTCHPTSYSQLFKNACPRAYSYAYDDGTSTFTCPGGTGYLISFCPATPSQKKSDDNQQAVPTLGGGGGGYSAMVFHGGLVSSRAAASSRPTPPPLLLLLAAAVSCGAPRLLRLDAGALVPSGRRRRT